MRVIVGRFRGRRLIAPEGLSTRPILDRVKVALFDRLGARWGLPGELPDFDVLDLYAGGGSLGIEALSRGARTCCFVESARPALTCLRENIAALALDSSARIIAGPAETAAIPSTTDGYRLIFLDPPYPITAAYAPASPLARLFGRLGQEIPVGADALIVWRFDRAYMLPESLPGGWASSVRHDYGTMSLAFLERRPA